jgi:NAD(P)H-dependent flavin oxidoreductase YrpB (nitropropane dioxygenase family)
MIQTKACTVLGITHPIVQAGMSRYGTNAALVAAVSAAGGLGVLGCLGRPLDETLAEIRGIRALTDRPFAVNFVLHLLDEQVFAACLAERVPVFSFFRGDPAEATARAHQAGAVVIHQCTTVAEAERARRVGVDVIVAQGTEAGGHNGPIPLFGLLPDVVDAAGGTPVLAAGGIVDCRGLAAALCLGASGVLMGTRFLATHECPATPRHKQAILDAAPGATVASGVPDTLWGEQWPGVQARAIRNQVIDRWQGREDQLRADWHAASAQLAQAEVEDDPDEILLLAGMGAGRINELLPAGEVVRKIVAEAEVTLRTHQFFAFTTSSQRT